MLVAVVLIFILYIERLPAKTLVTYSIALIAICIFISYKVITSDDNSVLSRTRVLFDSNLVLNKMAKRIEPFTQEVKTWDNPIYWLLGKGIGKSIYIPWFEYRKNINNYNSYLDNIYLSLYIKLGIVSVVVYFYIFFYFYRLSNNLRYTSILTAYLLFMGLTTAFMYQSSFFVFLLSPALFYSKTKKYRP